MRDDDHDDVLARRAADGDSEALDALLRDHTALVHGVCRRILGNPDDALDATQEALLAIARKIGSFDGRAKFSTWVYRVATNAALDEARRRGRRPVPTESLPETGREHRTAPRPTPAIADRLDVDAALAQLTPEYRAAVALRDLVGMDYAEIAEVLGIPPGTVRSRISRGRAALADLLGNRETPSEHPTALKPMNDDTSPFEPERARRAPLRRARRRARRGRARPRAERRRGLRRARRATPGADERRAALAAARDLLVGSPEIDELLAARLRAKAVRAGRGGERIPTRRSQPSPTPDPRWRRAGSRRRSPRSSAIAAGLSASRSRHELEGRAERAARRRPAERRRRGDGRARRRRRRSAPFADVRALARDAPSPGRRARHRSPTATRVSTTAGRRDARDIGAAPERRGRHVAVRQSRRAARRRPTAADATGACAPAPRARRPPQLPTRRHPGAARRPRRCRASRSSSSCSPATGSTPWSSRTPTAGSLNVQMLR